MIKRDAYRLPALDLLGDRQKVELELEMFESLLLHPTEARLLAMRLLAEAYRTDGRGLEMVAALSRAFETP